MILLSSASRGPGLRRMLSGTLIFPMSWSQLAMRSSCRSSSPRPRPSPNCSAYATRRSEWPFRKFCVDSRQNLRNGHSERLVAYAEQLGEGLGLGDEDLHELRIASWLHDIGKINVPESILLKPGPLDAEERRIMQEHPIIGEKICAPLKSLRRILPVIRHHHEKMDGSGYPDGLRGEAIPLKAKILQIADIYDALTTNRPYRGALPPEEALQTLFSEAQNGWLDASVVLKFSQICRDGERFPVTERTMLASYHA